MINKALKTLRQFHGLSVLEVSTRTNLEIETIKGLESGRLSPKKNELKSYATSFDLPEASLVFIAESFGKNHKSNNFKNQIKLHATKKLLSIMEWMVEREQKKKIKA
jgi:transcriptional regulator with XRE-family HTH domain